MNTFAQTVKNQTNQTMKNTSNYMLTRIALFAIILFGQLNLLGQDDTPWILGGNSSGDSEAFGRYGRAGDLLFVNSLNYDDYDMVLTYDPSYLGIGTLNPASDLHIHSSIVSPVDDSGDEDSDISTRDMNLQKSVARLQLTNHETGITEDDGLLIKMYNNNASIYNQESGSLTLLNNGLRLSLEENGNISLGDNSNAYFSVNMDGNVTAENTFTTGRLNIAAIPGYQVNEITASGSGLDTEWNKIGSFKLTNDNNSLVLYTGGGSNERTSFIQSGHSQGVYSDVLGVLALNPFGGNVGIGTAEPVYKLDVAGEMRACKIRVNNTDNWCDYVFEEDYDLMPLDTLDAFVKANKHLPGIPTEAEVMENGVDLGEMNKKLLEKVEELSLYVISLQKQIDELKNEKMKTNL